MTTIIKGLEPQPQFPQEDLTENNAAVLELMLMNKEFVNDGHVSAESNLEFFRFVHPTITKGIDDRYNNVRRVQAADHGVAAYETVTLLVGARWRHLMFLSDGNPKALATVANWSGSTNFADSALTVFKNEMCNTADVVRTSAQRFHGSLADYALLSAAIAWYTEIAFTSPNTGDAPDKI